MAFPDTFRASTRKLLEEVTESARTSSLKEAVPEIFTGFPGSDLSVTGTVYVSWDQAERVRQRKPNMAALTLITVSNKATLQLLN